jgi:hypothetical protein
MLMQAIMPHLPWYCSDSTVSIRKAFLMKFHGLNYWLMLVALILAEGRFRDNVCVCHGFV